MHEVKSILISKSVRLWDFLKKENERYGHPNNDLQKKKLKLPFTILWVHDIGLVLALKVMSNCNTYNDYQQ